MLLRRSVERQFRRDVLGSHNRYVGSGCACPADCVRNRYFDARKGKNDMSYNIAARDQRWNRVIALIFLAALMVTLMVVPAFATGSVGAEQQIVNGVSSGMYKLYSLFQALLAPIAVVLVVWNVFKALFFGEKGMEGAKKGIIIILAIVAVVYLAPLIVSTVSGWFSGASGSTTNQVFSPVWNDPTGGGG